MPGCSQQACADNKRWSVGGDTSGLVFTSTLEGPPWTALDFRKTVMTVVTGSGDAELRLWDVQTGACLKTLKGHEQIVTSCAFSPDGSKIVTASKDRKVRIWSVVGGNTVKTLKESHAESHTVTGCSFSPDGTRIALTTWTERNNCKLYDAVTGNRVLTLTGHTDVALLCVFSSSGLQIATTSSDRTCRVWNASTGECISTLEGHADAVGFCAFSSDTAHICTVSRDMTAKVWDWRKKEPVCVRTLVGHTGALNSCAFLLMASAKVPLSPGARGGFAIEPGPAAEWTPVKRDVFRTSSFAWHPSV